MNIQNKRALATIILTIGVTLPLLAESDDDKRIVATAKDSYVFKTYLANDHIHIKSKDGYVTLKGQVANGSEKSMAADTVQSLPGVRAVDNELTVGAEPAKGSDAWLTFKVKSALLFHRSVSAAHTTVSVSNGMVTLTGQADSQAEKDLTTQYAKDVDGVADVNNQMTVAATAQPPSESTGQKVDDASITAQVKATLLAHRSTSALKTDVSTTDGVVTVSGPADNQAEKDLVTKLVSDVNGVTNVVNNMDTKQ